jgi:hypothetical protein
MFSSQVCSLRKRSSYAEGNVPDSSFIETFSERDKQQYIRTPHVVEFVLLQEKSEIDNDIIDNINHFSVM